MRKVKGDGNCYYRSVANGYIEYLATNKAANALKDLVNWIRDDREDNLYYLGDY